MNNIKFYALRNKDTGIFSNVFMGRDDKVAAQFMLNELQAVMNEAEKQKVDHVKLLDNFRKESIYKIAEFNPESGLFDNDMIELVDLKDLQYIKKEEKKDEQVIPN